MMDRSVYKFTAGARMYKVMKDEDGGVRLLWCVPPMFWQAARILNGSDCLSDAVRELASLATAAARDRENCAVALAARDAAVRRVVTAEGELAGMPEQLPGGSREFE